MLSAYNTKLCKNERAQASEILVDVMNNNILTQSNLTLVLFENHMYWFQSSEISSDGMETRQFSVVCETRSTDPTNDRPKVAVVWPDLVSSGVGEG